eukprot:g2090.t1
MSESVQEPNYGLAFLLVIIAGLSTTFGAVAVMFDKCVQLTDKRFLASSLALSAGVMIYVSFVEIFVKSVEAFQEQKLSWAYLAATMCLFAGCGITVGLDMLVHKLVGGHHSHGTNNPPYGVSSTNNSPKMKNKKTLLEESVGDDNVQIEIGKVKISESEDADIEKEDMNKDDDGNDNGFVNEDKSRMHKTGLLVALALGIHNFPEGLITFVGALTSPSVGIALCIAITIHNIPEGLCVAIPIFYATGDRKKAFLYAFASGVAEPVGALLGFAVIKAVGGAAFGVIFGIVGGMMIYICFSELIPTALRHDPENQYVTRFVIIGMLVMAISLVMFQDPYVPPEEVAVPSTTAASSNNSSRLLI